MTNEAGEGRPPHDDRDNGAEPGARDERDEAGWPVEVRGITESVVTTLGPDDRWNVAALGLHAGDPVTARTWGRTRTRRNFRERGGGYVQFTRDPVDFVDAALGVWEVDDPVLESADAWAEVTVGRVDSGQRGGTEWVEWELGPEVSTVERVVVPTTNRGHNAVVEATIAASRLHVDAYDRSQLETRLEWLQDVVGTCGGEPEQNAFALVREYTE